MSYLGAAAILLAATGACAQPEPPANNPTPLFSSREGFDADGHWKLAFEAQMFLYLPASDTSIGLNRPAGTGTGINVSRPRPTIADVVNDVAFAFDCDYTVRYGDFSAELSVLYIDTKQHTTVPPLPPSLPAARLNSKFSVVYVSPGIGYRVLRYDIVSVDLRAGFTYSAIDADAEFSAGQFARGSSYSPNLIQPWLGGRVAFYPSPRWRIENDAAATGIGGPGGWNDKIAVSYLISRWFDVSFGYRASETRDDPGPRPDGAQRGIKILLHGPMVAFGVRF